jgi:hypothetical protein
MSRVVVVSGPERHRWSAEQKRAIVAESLAPGAVVTEIACRKENWARPDLSRAVSDRVGNGFAPVLTPTRDGAWFAAAPTPRD